MVDVSKYRGQKLTEAIGELRATHQFVRVFKSGDMLTADHRPDRLNVQVDEENNIIDIYIG